MVEDLPLFKLNKLIIGKDKDKDQFYRQLVALKDDLRDDEEADEADELRVILRNNTSQKSLLLQISSSPSYPSSPSTSQIPAAVRRKHMQSPTTTPNIHRTTSEPILVDGIVNETPSLPRIPSLLRYNISTPSRGPELSMSGTSIIKETPLVLANPETTRSVSTPIIGSVFMKNSSGIASMLNKRPALSNKRKRKTVIKLAPEPKRVLAGLTFFYVPNDDVAKERRTRIARAIEYGATWATEWTMDISHVFVDKRNSYEQVMEYLVPIIKADFLPSSICLVNEDYPFHCIQFNTLLDPKQDRYSVVSAPKMLQETIPESNELRHIKKGRPRKDGAFSEKNTPPRSQRSTQVDALSFEEALQDEWNNNVAATGETREGISITYVPRGNALDECIAIVLKTSHLPVDDDDSERPSSSEGQEETGSIDEESATRALAKPKVKLRNKGMRNQENFGCMKGGTGITHESNPNKHTISILEQMAVYYSQYGDEWRTRAYRQAAGILKKQTSGITCYEDAIVLPRIGERLAKKIEEIAQTNHLRRLDSARLNPTDQTIHYFTRIYNVGFSVASKWAQAGYRTLDDLRAHADLTPKQIIGIEHYEDFNTRIPRAEVTALGEIVQKEVDSIDSQVTAMIMGSYRRGAADSGDIDMLITKEGTRSSQDLLPFLQTLVAKLFKQGFLVAALAEPRDKGGSKWHGACILSPENPIWRRIDFLLVPETQMGAALIYFTGDDHFNRSIRLLSSKKGMRLNQVGLFKDVLRGHNREKLNEGTLVEGADEKRIFEILGVPYFPPEQRILH